MTGAVAPVSGAVAPLTQAVPPVTNAVRPVTDRVLGPVGGALPDPGSALPDLPGAGGSAKTPQGNGAAEHAVAPGGTDAPEAPAADRPPGAARERVRAADGETPGMTPERWSTGTPAQVVDVVGPGGAVESARPPAGWRTSLPAIGALASVLVLLLAASVAALVVVRPPPGGRRGPATAPAAPRPLRGRRR